jgi:SpoIID/LytB domain protein
MSIRLRRSIAVAAITLLVFSHGAVADAEDISFTGSGWGNGVGFSQYGARAMADAGDPASTILGHYYPGAVQRNLNLLFLGSHFLKDETPVWVGLLQNQTEVTFQIEDGMADLCFDTTEQCVATVVPGEKWKFGPDGNGNCGFFRQAGLGSWSGGYVMFPPSGSCSASARPVLDPTTISVPLKGRSYRSGTLRFRPSPTSSGIHLVLQLGIDDFVRGIQELPDFWPGSALEAQAIVSRTLAVKEVLDHGPVEEFGESRLELCACHILDNNPDQVYGGYTAEQGHPFWQGRVGATTGQVMTWNNQVITAKFTSSTGGRTESNENADGSPLPYLVSVDDTVSLSTAADNPFSTWTTSSSRTELASLFGFSWIGNATVTSRHESGSAATVTLRGIVEGESITKTLEGNEVRSAAGLHSQYFEITVSPVFADVSSEHPFASEIVGLRDLGISTGCTPTLFCPDVGVTRGEMAAFLVRALDLGLDTETDPFTDDDGSVFEEEIEILYANGITTGCTTTTFCPTGLVTREQMAAFVTRSFGLTAPSVSTDPFTDDDGSAFEEEIETLYANGVTTGCTTTTFCPTGLVTREQMAAFLIRALAVS